MFAININEQWLNKFQQKIEGFKIDLQANNAIKSTEIGDVEESRDAYATINTLLPNVNN